MFASGLSVKYGPSMLVAKEEGGNPNSDVASSIDKQDGTLEQASANKLTRGMRFPSAQVLNHSSARPWQFAHFLPSDGRFRVVLFAGNLQSPAQLDRIMVLCDILASKDSFLHRYTPSEERIDARIELLTIHSGPRTAIELLALPDILHPFDEKRGWDYDKVFVDDMSYHEGHGKAYAKYGIDRERGCLVVVRPDQVRAIP